jgi:hypothetical protein
MSNNLTLQSGSRRLFDMSPIEPEPTFGRLLWLGGGSSTGLSVGANGIGEGGGAVEKFSVSLPQWPLLLHEPNNVVWLIHFSQPGEIDLQQELALLRHLLWRDMYETIHLQ